MRALVHLRQDRPPRHRPELALELELIGGPHLGQAAHELVPALLGDVGIGVEPGQLGPRGGATGPDLHATAGEDVEHRRPLGDLDRVVELRHAYNDPEPDADALRERGAHRQE
jgi:hypothetical protein